ILPKTLFNNPQNKLVYLYGKREEKGAYIEVTLPASLIKRKKAQRLHTVLHEVCNSIDYDNLEITNEVEKKAIETLKQGINIKVGIAEQWQFRKGEDLGQVTEKIGAKIGLGLPIRQCPAFLSEMIAF